MSYGLVTMPPGGLGLPFNLQPPFVGSPPVIALNPVNLHGQLPGEGDGPGDTQLSYPDAPATPAAPTFSFASGTPLVISYIESGASVTSVVEDHGAPAIRIYCGANAAGPGVPGSVSLTFRGRTYVDRSGSLYYNVDPATNAGTLGGSYDYTLNIATLTDYGTGANTVVIVSLATRYVEIGITGTMFRTNARPLRPGSFSLAATTMDGTALTGTVDINGDITGTDIKGHVDWTSGLVRIAFGVKVTAAGNESQPWYDVDLIDGLGKIWKPIPVDPGSVTFGTVAYHTIPVDPTLIGIDPVRLPSDGRVLGFNPGTLAVVSHTQTTNLTPTASAVTNLGRDRIGFIELYDAAKVPIDSIWYTLDLDAGTVTWANPLNLSAYTMPVTIRDRIQDVRLIADVQITGEITLAGTITHDYPAGAVVSNAILFADTQSRVTNVFDQATYSAGVWSDDVVGTPSASTYNTVTYPFEVENDAAIDERWAIVFQSPTSASVIGETVGQVLTGVPIGADIAPINPVTITLANPSGTPYFIIRTAGWGGGWSAGNVLRFNSISATRPTWLARVVVPGDITVANDAVRAQVYGNAH